MNTKPMTKKLQRICENIFDVMMETQFHDEAKKQLGKDLQGHNVFVNYRKGIIEIQDLIVRLLFLH